VERPVLTDGRWLARDDEVVLEQAFATALDLAPGATITVRRTGGEARFTVVGLAVLAGGGTYPQSQPGAAFSTARAIETIQPDPSQRGYTEAIRLDDPTAAARFAFDTARLLGDGVVTDLWQERRSDATEANRTTSVVLLTFTAIVLGLVAFVLSTLVGARVLARSREIGLLKAVGLTPSQVARLFLVEQLAIGLVGGLVGAVAGALLTPALAGGSAGLIVGVSAAVSPARLILVLATVEALVGIVTLVPSLRGGRNTVVAALAAAEGGAAGSRLSRLVPLGRSPSVSVGMKQALTRPGRTAMTILAIALTVGSLVAGLAMEATMSHEDAAAALVVGPAPSDQAGLTPAGPDPITAGDPTRAQLRPIVHVMNALVLLVAIGGLLAGTNLSVRERRRELGILKALGLVPGQIVSTVVSSHGLLGIASAAIGIPLGLGLFDAVYGIVNGNTTLATMPPAWQLALVPLATAVGVLVATGLPARRAASISAVQAMRRD
jgi:putative ABC transport system permease protein